MSSSQRLFFEYPSGLYIMVKSFLCDINQQTYWQLRLQTHYAYSDLFVDLGEAPFFPNAAQQPTDSRQRLLGQTGARFLPGRPRNDLSSRHRPDAAVYAAELR